MNLRRFSNIMPLELKCHIGITPTIPQLAQRFGVSARTILRYKARGVDVHSVLAVGRHILRNRHATETALEAVTAALAQESERLVALPKQSHRDAFAEVWRENHQPTK